MHMDHGHNHGDMDMGGQCNMNASTLQTAEYVLPMLTFSSSY